MASADGVPAQHPDPDDLALLAVEPDGPDAAELRSHLAGCRRCRAEVDDLRAVVETARATAPAGDDLRRMPPASVWGGIAAATGVRTAPDPAALRRSLGERGGSTAGPAAAAAPTAAVPPRQRRSSRWSAPALAGVALGCLLLGGLAGAALRGALADRGTNPTVATGTVAMSTVLGPVTSGPEAGTGSAEVLRAADDGTADQRVVVATTGLPESTGVVHEVWLLDPATGGLLALGHLDAAGASPPGGYQLPTGVDLQRYSVLDVSAEPLDGDAAHSGTSELRGQLREAGTTTS